MIMDFLKRLGGAATGKVEKMVLEYVPWDFAVDKMSLKNILASVVTYAVADYYLERTNPTIAELLKTGAAVIMADELEKEARGFVTGGAGTTAVAPKAVPVKATTPTTTARKGIIIA